MARKTVGLNTSSAADISFLLLTFFLLTSNIDTDQGIPRRLPPKKTQEIKVEVNKRNVLDVRVNFRNEIVMNADNVDIDQVKDKAKEFLANPYNSIHLPEKEVKLIPNLGEYPVSKGVVSLQNDMSTTYETYLRVQNELQRAVNELRNEVSNQYFGQPYNALDTARQRAIQKAIPMNISEAPPADLSKQQ